MGTAVLKGSSIILTPFREVTAATTAAGVTLFLSSLFQETQQKRSNSNDSSM